MVALVSWVTVVMGIILFVVAMLDIGLTWKATIDAKKAVGKVAEDTKNKAEAQQGLVPQAGPDFKSAWEGLASLAAALKDLDRGSRLLVLSLAFLAVAGVLTGVDTVADAIKAP